MNRLNLVMWGLLFSNFVQAFGDSLIAGTAVNDSNIHELAETSWEYAKASTTQKKFESGFAKAFLKVEGNKLYSLSGSSTLYLTNFDTREVLGQWPLRSPATCSEADPDCEEPLLTGRWSDQEFLEPELKQLFNSYGGLELNLQTSNVGCLAEHPLQYGDIDGDSINELFLVLSDNFLIFDIEKQRTIFLTLWNVDDWRNAADTLEQLGSENNQDHPQYVSKLATFSAVESQISEAINDAGYRGYTKMYVDDFNNDGQKDLVLWRKLYQSRLQSDELRGFKKLSDFLLHYQKIDGEYQLMETDHSSVQDWLVAKQLTWQLGYPTKSECVGQEGQLIPEMHDVLLNDPDVLK